MMLKTAYELDTVPHRFMWQIVEEQAQLAGEREEEWSRPALVAMVFAFHTVEAYLNFVGERLAPDIWQKERIFFSKGPYRGWKGKLCKVMELVHLDLPPEKSPLKTIYELKKLRDMIAHGKPEKVAGEIVHAEGSEIPLAVSTLRSMFTPKEKLTTAVSDVKKFLNLIHARAALKVKNDPWFGDDPLCGPEAYNFGSTTLA
ncbi:MAG: hypothetical protein ACRD2P_01165 [Terriglobia bacterium]